MANCNESLQIQHVPHLPPLAAVAMVAAAGGARGPMASPCPLASPCPSHRHHAHQHSYSRWQLLSHDTNSPWFVGCLWIGVYSCGTQRAKSSAIPQTARHLSFCQHLPNFGIQLTSGKPLRSCLYCIIECTRRDVMTYCQIAYRVTLI